MSADTVGTTRQNIGQWENDEFAKLCVTHNFANSPDFKLSCAPAHITSEIASMWFSSNVSAHTALKVVRAPSDGRYQMISGHHRMVACKRAGATCIAAWVVGENAYCNPFKELAIVLIDAYKLGISNAFTLRLKEPFQEVHIAFKENQFTGEYLEFPNIQWLQSWHDIKDLYAAFSMWNIPVCSEVFEWGLFTGASFFRAADIGRFQPNQFSRESLDRPKTPGNTEPDFSNYLGKDCVYFIQASKLKLVKIGFSANVGKRLKALETGCPDDLKILKVIPGGQQIENQIHQKFSHERVKGEWFTPSPELMRYIEMLGD